MLDVAAVGIAVIDHNGDLVQVNGQMRRLVSRDCDLSPGQPIRAIFCDKRSPGVWEELAPVLEGRGVLRGYASVILGRHERRVQPVEITATPLREQDATISGAIVQFLDLSAQKALESQLHQSQKMQAMGQLAGGIAHDFNNLLTALLGSADDAIDRAQADAETMDALRQIRASAVRGAGLVRQLLAFGRQQALEPRAVNLAAAIGDLLTLLRRLLGSNVALDLDLPRPGRTVRVDATQFDQVLVNLVVNARDAMPNGGRLTVRTGELDLIRPLVRDGETIPPGNYATIEVQDTGSGIPADVLPRIFEPFFTTRREQGGTGLGLSTVHGIVRQSSGFLAVDSAVGKGTRVRIYLPRVDEAEPVAPVAPAETASQPPAGDAVGTILLVDDEEAVLRVTERALSRRGWRVLPAACADAALALLAEPQVGAALSAVVSDLTMPGRDGAALVEAVRAIRPGLPAIVVSGYANDAVRQRMAEADIQFMPKPYNVKDLIAALPTRPRDAANHQMPADMQLQGGDETSRNMLPDR